MLFRWVRGKTFQLKHVDTGKFLYTSDSAKFNQQNCGGGCPIMGQTEVSAFGKKDSPKTMWQTSQGIYFPGSKSNSQKKTVDDDDDL